MAFLRNVSSRTIVVGGWQQDQLGTGLPLDPNGAAMHLPVPVLPGASIEVDRQSLDHPVVVALARSSDWELIDVENVAGGAVVANPSQPAGAILAHRRLITAAELAAFGAVSSGTIQLGSIPAGSVIHDAYLEVSVAYSGGTLSAMDFDLSDRAGSGAEFISDADGFATGIQQGGGLLIKDLPNGVDLDIDVDSTGDDLDATAAGSAVFVVLYSILM